MKKLITFTQAIDGYKLYFQARRLSPNTYADYDNTFRKFSDFLAGDPPIVDITTDQVKAFLASQTGVSKKTLLNYHIGLSALWTWCVEEELVKEHAGEAVPGPVDRCVYLFQHSLKTSLAYNVQVRRCLSHVQFRNTPGIGRGAHFVPIKGDHVPRSSDNESVGGSRTSEGFENRPEILRCRHGEYVIRLVGGVRKGLYISHVEVAPERELPHRCVDPKPGKLMLYGLLDENGVTSRHSLQTAQLLTNRISSDLFVFNR